MTYRVRSGDTLAAIAGRFGTTVKALQALNGIDNPRLIRIGQVLQIP
jgi:LysM repeat protein